VLVLSRKPGEKLMIGDNIVITILAINGNRVRVGIEAPKEIPVLRSEVDDRSLPKRRHSPEAASTAFDERYSPVAQEDDFFLPRRSDG